MVKKIKFVVSDYKNLFLEVSGLLNRSRRSAVRSINSIIVVTYWQIGRRIVEFEQKGQVKAEYGEMVVDRLAKDLTVRFGRGFSRRNVFQMKLFYLAYKRKVQTVSAQLSWSHYVRLISLDNDEARDFYESETVRGGWSVRQLDRQMSSQFYERVLLSRKKSAMLLKGQKSVKGDLISPEEEIKDPAVLEFLDLKDEYSESDLEEALIYKLQDFLLEMGYGFTFVARQKRIKVGNDWYRMDLLLYHRKLRCLVVVDLKVGKFTHADVGQMNLYLNYANENMTLPQENQSIGIILCAEKDESVVHYALGGMNNKIFSSQYKLQLPDERKLKEELRKARGRP